MLFERYPSIHCSISGGEPSVSPFFPEMIKTFRDAGHTVVVTSNAAKPVDWWLENSVQTPSLVFSYHAEFPDAQFVDKVTRIGRVTNVGTRVMMHPAYWDHCVDVYNQLYEIEHINVEPVRILDYRNENLPAHQYTAEQLQWILDHPATLDRSRRTGNRYRSQVTVHFDDGSQTVNPNFVDYINAGQTRFAGYTCHIGLQSLHVKWDGSVTLGNCGVGGLIGNINDPLNIRWPTEPIQCSRPTCDCVSDVLIEKYQN